MSGNVIPFLAGPQHRTVWQQNADALATRDREGAATLVLEVAVHEAIEELRAGNPVSARLVLGKAGGSAARILGERPRLVTP